MCDSDFELAAWWVESGGISLYVVKRTGSNQQEVWQLTAPGQLPTYLFSLGAQPAGVGFPWGIDVEPD